VVLVGAGPGAPDLVTVRGERALRAADAVVYDALAPAELVALAPAHAERIDVGRRGGHETPPRSQEEISALLVRLAREGKTVVRLKGGDPFVFGRGGEEVSACVAAGVEVEVVPGVSSAIGALAAAGIPVTDRRCAASFAVVTGHKDPTRAREAIRWDELARGADTLVVLMGMRELEEITRRILAAGRAPETPAAVVMEGTLPEQRVVVAPLAGLARAAREAGLRAPAAIVVGGVVALREELAPRPLAGLRVAVTRPAEQDPGWLVALRAAGALPESIPLVRVEPLAAPAELDAGLARLAEYDAVLLTSANAARALAARAAALGVRLAGVPALCVGPATAAAAAKAGLAATTPRPDGDAEALLAALRAKGPLAGRRYLLPRGERARDVLPEGLRAEGARVDAPVAYRTLLLSEGARALRECLVRGALDALTFASPSAVRSFAACLDPAARAACRSALVAAVGPATAAALREAGIPPDAVAARPGADGLIEALAAAVRERAGGGGAT
jgi:uroporphyrinogen III methyltransferase/synthase